MKEELKLSEKLITVAGLLSTISVAVSQLAVIVKLIEDDRISDYRPHDHNQELNTFNKREYRKDYFEI